MNRLRIVAAAAAGLLLLPLLPPTAGAVDTGSIQVTVPAPNPVVAGEVVTFQILGVNAGSEAWTPGTYSWEVQLFDLDYNYQARADSVLPQETVNPGGVSSAFVRFTVPEQWLGRRFYKVFLVHNGNRIAESEYQPFQVSARPSQAPPVPQPVEKYKLGGNLNLALKAANPPGWKAPTAASTLNLIGKLDNSSFLFNSYFLHDHRQFINPVVLLLVYYAPWGTISAGDISPSFSPLSLSSLGLRGAMLDQEASYVHWTVLGGQTATAEAGNVTTNGRYQRLLFGLKAEKEVLRGFKPYVDYTLGFDDTSSLSTDPNSPRFRGPTLTPQKNPVYGGGFVWTPGWYLSFLTDYQISQFKADATSGRSPNVKDKAWRGEVRWEMPSVKLRVWMQRAGTNFRSFGAPSIVPDRVTQDVNLFLAPLARWNVQASVNQYKDNLLNDRTKATTTQRTTTLLNTAVFPTGTTVSVRESRSCDRRLLSTNLLI